MGRDRESPPGGGGVLNNSPLGDVSEEEEEWDSDPPELMDNLSKWTNYIHGWQPRFMALKVIKLIVNVTYLTIRIAYTQQRNEWIYMYFIIRIILNVPPLTCKFTSLI